MRSSFQIVGDLLPRSRFFALNEHLHLALFGPDDHGLVAHPSHHVERRAWLPSQGQFERVFFQAPLDDLAQVLGNGKEAISGTQPVQRLMGPLVVVVLHP